jgi:hypothetical protein
MSLAGADRVTVFNDHAGARAWLLEGERDGRHGHAG